MPEETKKEPTAAPAVDTRLDDALKVIKAQDEHLVLANEKIKELETLLSESTAKVSALEKKIKVDTKAVAAAPKGNVVQLDGKTWEIRRTVKAKFALEEVKRGNIAEDASLIVTDRTE